MKHAGQFSEECPTRPHELHWDSMLRLLTFKCLPISGRSVRALRLRDARSTGRTRGDDVTILSTGRTIIVLGAIFCEMVSLITVLTEQCDAGNIYRVELAVTRYMSEVAAELAMNCGRLILKSSG